MEMRIFYRTKNQFLSLIISIHILLWMSYSYKEKHNCDNQNDTYIYTKLIVWCVLYTPFCFQIVEYRCCTKQFILWTGTHVC